MSYREGNLQQPPLAATQSLEEESCWVDLQQTLCLEFALYWLMWSCCRDLHCRRHAHPQCLFSRSSSPPEWVAPSSPGLHPDRYLEGMLALTQAQEPAPSSAAARRLQTCWFWCFLWLIRWRCSSIQGGAWMCDFSFIFYFGTDFSQKYGTLVPSCTSVWHPQMVNVKVWWAFPKSGVVRSLVLLPWVIECDWF